MRTVFVAYNNVAREKGRNKKLPEITVSIAAGLPRRAEGRQMRDPPQALVKNLGVRYADA